MKKTVHAALVSIALLLFGSIVFAAPSTEPPYENLPNANFNSLRVVSGLNVGGSVGKFIAQCTYSCQANVNAAVCIAAATSGSLAPSDDCSSVLACSAGNNNVFVPEYANPTPSVPYRVFRQCTGPVSVAGGVQFADGSVKKSNLGSFIGASDQGSKGKNNGYASAAQACGASFPNESGVHVCTYDEMINTVVNFSSRAAYTNQLNSTKEVLWLNSTPSPYSTGSAVGQTNDCKGWTSDSSTVYAAAWIFKNALNHASVVPCNQTLKYACCVY